MGEKEAQDYIKKHIQKTKDSNMTIYKRAMENLAELKALQKKLYQGGSTSSMGLYKYFTMSFKVFQLQPKTKKIHDLLKIIAGEELSPLYIDLVKEALSKKFVFAGKASSYGEDGFNKGIAVRTERNRRGFMAKTRNKIAKLMGRYVKETNDNWVVETNPILFAYMVSERILDELICLCENEINITDEDLGSYGFTELNAIFSTY